MKRLRAESGQAMVMVAVFLVTSISLVAFAVDIGSWYREHRQAQSTADAAALSGAQLLPENPDLALDTAQTYADDNGAGVIPDGIKLRSDYNTNDTVVVTVQRTAPGFFSKAFGIDSVNVGATAAARSGVPIEVKGAAPIVVSKFHPLLAGPGCPCLNVATTLPLSDIGAPGGFGLMNMDPTGPNVGQSTFATWVSDGYDDYLALGKYLQETGAKFSGNATTDALGNRLGTDLLFPVFDSITGGGTNAQYNIVAWVGFHLTKVIKVSGNEFKLSGWFTSVIWDGVQSNKNPHIPDFGVHTISLVN
jgi:Flp pilus assembly protein TadG